MKQFQFEFKNINNLYRELNRIDRFCQKNSYNSVFFQIFAKTMNPDDITPITSIIEEKFPNAYYYGSQSYGHIIDGELGRYDIEIVCSIFEYDNTTAELFFIDKNDPRADFNSLENLWIYCNSIKNLKLVELSCSHGSADIFNLTEHKLVLREDISVIGSIAADSMDITSNTSFVFSKGVGFSYTGAFAVLLSGDDLHVATAHHTGWQGLGRTFTITKANGKIIEEIDNEPAMDIYNKYLGISYDNNFMYNSMHFPLLLMHNGIEKIRVPMPHDNHKEIKLTVNITSGTKVRLSYGEPSTILKNVYNQLNYIYKFNPDTIRVYSCAMRRIFWGDARIGEETSSFDTIASTIGFYTHGELIRIGDYIHYLNSTLLTCLVREGDITSLEYNIDDIMRYNPKSIEFSDKLIHFVDAMSKDLEGRFMRNIISIANTYRIMWSLNLKEDTLTPYEKIKDIQKSIINCKTNQERLNRIILDNVVPVMRDVAYEFGDLSTIQERIGNQNSLFAEFIGKKEGWFRAQFIPVVKDENGKLIELLLTVQNIDEIKRREEELLHQALTDSQTKLLNRRAYEEDMLKLINSPYRKRFTYIAMDINGLKKINDNLGHAAGDELIKASAKIMRQVYLPYGKIYRIGGDEFVAIITTSDVQLEVLKEDFYELVDKWSGKLVSKLSISTGYVTKDDVSSLSIDDIEKLADTLMYKEKIEYYSMINA